MSTRDVAAAFQYTNWDRVPITKVSEGIERQLIWGDKVMVCRLRIAPNVVTPVHSHVHEQITLVAQGRVRYFVAGKEQICSPGDVLYFPPNLEHGATMLEEEVVLIDIFTPLREDFLT